MTPTLHEAAPPPAADTVGVRATARIAATAAEGATRITTLDGDGPFELRRLRPRGGWARVIIVGAMSAPLGGDRLRIEATADHGAALHISSATATLALKGATSEPATYDVHLTVGEGAQLHWSPQPLISAARSDLRQTLTVDLAATARLVLREEQALGRAGEPPGHLATRLTVRRGGRTLLDQQAAYGPGAPGWDGPAVLSRYRATGQLLLVDPAFAHNPVAPLLLTAPSESGRAVLAPLAGPAVLITAVAQDGLRLRSLLDRAYRAASGPPD
ncbi:MULTISPECIES: urease accessory protein UreD [unclassified Streptomyces]|uniref:urease accessory protein UreD n=1 Tax=unclassified Streptomyces TaxID=2593676 RepID=UPI000C274B2B|nr:urease accessory protein UreD [Streptomyces sp. CB02959]PJN41392.1 urease accessory protein [Streptomyces sp. CB02959]